jgi:ketosteroid isomerase-like protein
MDVRREIHKKNEAWNRAYNRRSADGCAAIFTDDPVMLAPNRPAIRGLTGVREFFQTMIDEVGGHAHTEMVEFGIGGDLAYQIATYEFADTDKPDKGKFVEVFRRKDDGSWKVCLTIYNSDNLSLAVADAEMAMREHRSR